MNVESRRRWEDYTRAKEDMLARTHIPEAPRWVDEAVDKRRARPNCISHRLAQIASGNVEHPPVHLPERLRHADDVRGPVPAAMVVPSAY